MKIFVADVRITSDSDSKTANVSADMAMSPAQSVFAEGQELIAMRENDGADRPTMCRATIDLCRWGDPPRRIPASRVVNPAHVSSSGVIVRHRG